VAAAALGLAATFSAAETGLLGWLAARGATIFPVLTLARIIFTSSGDLLRKARKKCTLPYLQSNDKLTERYRYGTGGRTMPQPVFM